jgi:hypothetical protein
MEGSAFQDPQESPRPHDLHRPGLHQASEAPGACAPAGPRHGSLVAARVPDTVGNDNNPHHLRSAYIHLFPETKCRISE